MAKKCRSKKTTLRVNGNIVAAVTISGLSEIVGKSTDTIRRYEKLGIFPPAPIKDSSGIRYYPISLAKSLAEIVCTFKGNRPPLAEDIVKINQLFNTERNKYASKKG